MDLSIFSTPEAWISLVTLLFLEIVLGVDNIVFIIMTTDRLPARLQPLGRKLGLLGAFVSRALFLCFASFLVSMTNPLFTVPVIGWQPSLRDLVLALGGVYLIYKGATELHATLTLRDEKAENDDEAPRKSIGLVGAVATIMVMDVVFSIDSVITAVGLADHLIIMITAVMLAIILMMIFIDAIADFINTHIEMTILALTFIVAIGVLLVLDGLGLHTGIEIEALGISLEKAMVYFAMVFSLVMTLLQMRYRSNHAKWVAEQNQAMKQVVAADAAPKAPQHAPRVSAIKEEE